jgi:flagellar hook-length control protein FliK
MIEKISPEIIADRKMTAVPTRNHQEKQESDFAVLFGELLEGRIDEKRNPHPAEDNGKNGYGRAISQNESEEKGRALNGRVQQQIIKPKELKGDKTPSTFQDTAVSKKEKPSMEKGAVSLLKESLKAFLRKGKLSGELGSLGTAGSTRTLRPGRVLTSGSSKGKASEQGHSVARTRGEKEAKRIHRRPEARSTYAKTVRERRKNSRGIAGSESTARDIKSRGTHSRNVRARAWSLRISKASGGSPRLNAERVLKQEAKQETLQNVREQLAGKESVFISQKYEGTIPGLLLKQDYHIITKNADEIYSAFLKQFSFVVKNGGGEAHVVLEPEFLGRLKMDIKLNQREVNSVVLVDNQSVKDLIISRLNILEQSLLQHGFSLGSFQVEVNDGSTRFSPESQKQTKRKSGDVGILEEEVVLKTMFLNMPDWLSTVINVTA